MIARRSIFSFFFLLISLSLFGQRNILSPYSFSGIGHLSERTMAHQVFMGGSSRSFRDASSFSLVNPASMSALKYSTMEIGVAYEQIKQITSTEEDRLKNGKLNYFNLGIPILANGGLGFNFGMNPISEVGYFLQTVSQEEDTIDVLHTFEGKGGINAFNFGIGAEVIKGLSVGINADFVFGSITEVRDKQYVNNTDYFNYLDRGEASYRGIKWRFGVQYNSQIKGAVEQTIGATFSPNAKINTTTDRLVTTYNATRERAFLIDTILNNLGAQKELDFPTSFGVSYAIGNPSKWMNTLEYSADLYTNFVDLRGASGYADQQKFSFGGYIQAKDIEEIARARTFRDLMDITRIYYGVNYTKSYLDVFAEPIDQLGIGFGLGIPVPKKVRTGDGQSIKVVSRLNLGVQYNIRGTTSNDLLEERILEVRLGLTLSDKWFNQRKYQ